jgi:hypothetical protein
MLRTLTASSLLALASTSAMAQMTPMDMPTAPQTETSAESATSTTANDPQSAPSAPLAEPKELTVQKLVDAEFPTYDANKNDALEPLEFRAWVLALHDAAGEANAAKDPAAKAKWANAAFATADTDKSKKVTKAEMNRFLLG